MSTGTWMVLSRAFLDRRRSMSMLVALDATPSGPWWPVAPAVTRVSVGRSSGPGMSAGWSAESAMGSLILSLVPASAE